MYVSCVTSDVNDVTVKVVIQADKEQGGLNFFGLVHLPQLQE